MRLSICTRASCSTTTGGSGGAVRPELLPSACMAACSFTCRWAAATPSACALKAGAPSPIRAWTVKDHLFRTGGSGSVRGYHQSLGIKEGSATVGATSRFSAPKPRTAERQLGIAAFVDAGDAVDSLRRRPPGRRLWPRRHA